MKIFPREPVELRSVLLSKARRVRDIAARHADDVDRNARFPIEAAEAMREERLLSVHVPVELGGAGASLEDLSMICAEIGRGCSSSAMAYAMHQIQVGCLVRHGLSSAWVREYLAELVQKELLIASATSELGVGGDLRTSKCCVESDGSSFRLEKQASVISYGEHANDILVTARRGPESAPSDQVLVLVRKSHYTLERIGGWDTLGLRGTCSLGFVLRSSGTVDQILPESFAQISSATMVPYSHVLWTAVWLGIATESVSRARSAIQQEARKNPGKTPPNAGRLAEVTAKLHMLRAVVNDGRHEYERRLATPDSLESFAFVVRCNDLKISASELTVEIVSAALRIVGIAGYRNDTKVSLGRQLRDAYGAALQISNDRMYGTNAQLLLMARED